MKKQCLVTISPKAQKQLSKMPIHVQSLLFAWVQSVMEEGVAEIRKIPGYHDEPLKGDRKGQRSVRLNRAYRVIYLEKDSITLLEILVVEVNKHEY